MTSLTSFWCFCYLGTYFTPFSSVSTVEFEEADVSWVMPEAVAPKVFYEKAVQKNFPWFTGKYDLNFTNFFRPVLFQRVFGK